MKFRKLSKDISPKDIPWHIKEKKRRAKKLAAIKFDDAKGERNLVFPKVIKNSILRKFKVLLEIY